jgi:uncharacterized membrane protein YfcA
MDTTLLLTGLIIAITHAVEAITGFGCTILALPFITYLVGIHEAKVLLAIIGWILSLYIVITKFKHIQFRQFFVIVFLAGSAMPLGIYFFNHFPSETLKLVLGIFIIITAILQLKKAYFRAESTVKPPTKIHYILLLLGGVIHGAFATGGPFIVFYATKKLPNKGEFRATLSLLWLTLNTILFITDATFQTTFHNIYNIIFKDTSMTTNVLYLICMIPFLFVGIGTGEVIHNRVNADVFNKIVYWALFTTGIFIVAAHYFKQ